MAWNLHDFNELNKKERDTLVILEGGDKISLLRLGTLRTRALHMSWFTFFLAFFG